MSASKAPSSSRPARHVVIVTGAAQGIAALYDVVKELGKERAVASFSDAADAKHVQKLVDTAIEVFGSIDVLVANAGVNFRASLLDITEEDWEHIMRIDTQCFPMLSIYSANKFLIRGITQAAAIEFGSHGITVNSYTPGLIETDMMRETVDQLNSRSSWVAKCASATAVKRNGGHCTL
ncbi:hypothetical protein M422DRAFT_39072, partial [Sphaerobolus stellatus SS14]